MLRLLTLSILLVIVKSEYDASEVLGDWLPAASFPTNTFIPLCQKFKIETDSQKCTCGDVAEMAVLKFSKGNFSVTLPAVFADKAEDVLPKFNTECFCDDYSQYFVIKKISAHYFALYDMMPDHANSGKRQVAGSVFVKQIPKLSELQAVVNTVPDLRGKELAYPCGLSAFLSEDS